MLLTPAFGATLLGPAAFGATTLDAPLLRRAPLGPATFLGIARRLLPALLLGLGLANRGLRELDRGDRGRVLTLDQATHAEHHAHQHEGTEQQRDGQLTGHGHSVAGARDACMRPT